MDHRLGAADYKGFAAFEKIADDLGHGFRPLGADRMPGIVDENQMAVRDQLFVEMPEFRWDDPVERILLEGGNCLLLAEKTGPTEHVNRISATPCKSSAH